MSRSMLRKRHAINRRAFLYGAGGIAIGLPFLEGLPERSAWAAGEEPIFTFFLCAACGVEPKRFWPASTGALSSVLASGDKAVNELKDHAENLLIVKGVSYPKNKPQVCGHAEGLVQALTATAPKSTGSRATAAGPSVDVVISEAVNEAGTDPLTLYAGNINNGFIEERLSFDKSGNVRAAVDNPYRLYQELVTVAGSGGGTGGTGGGSSVTDELLVRRQSANDQVLAELDSLRNNPKLSAADKARLDQHFEAIRAIEMTMMDPDTPVVIPGCTLDGVNTAGLEAVKNYRYDKNAQAAGGPETIVELHMQLVAVAFACNFNRTATLQWGDGTDGTMYDVPSNGSLNWGLHYISHRTASNAELGQNSTAEAAHAEIDVVRMKTLASGLNHFRDRGLADKSVVLWTNHVAEGNHNMSNVPQIIWGNGGGYFKQGEYVEAGKDVPNGKLLNMVITAATGNTAPNFGSSGGGEIDAAKA